MIVWHFTKTEVEGYLNGNLIYWTRSTSTKGLICSVWSETDRHKPAIAVFKQKF